MKKYFPVLLFILLFSFLFISGYAYSGIIPANVFMEGIDIGGLTVQEAELKVTEHYKRIKFYYKTFASSLSPEELGISIDYKGTFEQLESRGIWQRVVMNFQESQFNLEKTIDENKITEALRAIGQGVSISPQDAYLQIVNDQIVTKPGIKGNKMELDLLKKIIIDNPLKNEYIIPIVVVEPVVGEKEMNLLKPDKLLAQYTTEFVKNQNRTENIRLACEAMKNLLIPSGAIFSFNETVGPREVERGYLMAMIILGGEFSPGLGGGICQVSSTLYNTVLLAGLEVIERHPHSLKIDYVPLGKDATVTYGLKDFRFKNNTPGYLLLDYNISGQNLTLYIYGSHPN
ncbi:MAG: hypothetical protein JM58_18070 [Peptococcaceae bacterium BICA1-8]|nr:MAG: hypothetical protein JM58_18070 [Peptococcaceae bacterium BICA1-8]